MNTSTGHIGLRIVLASLFVLLAIYVVYLAPTAEAQSEWKAYGADIAGTKYSSLDQINKDTVNNLRVAWRQSTIPDDIRQGNDLPPPVAVQNTPLMVGGLLYVSTPLGTIAALDATNGEVVWFDAAPEGAERRGGANRGVAYWADGNDSRIIAVVGSNLVAFNAETGERYLDFGEG